MKSSLREDAVRLFFSPSFLENAFPVRDRIGILRRILLLPWRLRWKQGYRHRLRFGASQCHGCVAEKLCLFHVQAFVTFGQWADWLPKSELPREIPSPCSFRIWKNGMKGGGTGFRRKDALAVVGCHCSSFFQTCPENFSQVSDSSFNLLFKSKYKILC